jgi:hypothetical protein
MYSLGHKQSFQVNEVIGHHWRNCSVAVYYFDRLLKLDGGTYSRSPSLPPLEGLFFSLKFTANTVLTSFLYLVKCRVVSIQITTDDGNQYLHGLDHFDHSRIPMGQGGRIMS